MLPVNRVGIQVPAGLSPRQVRQGRVGAGYKPQTSLSSPGDTVQFGARNKRGQRRQQGNYFEEAQDLREVIQGNGHARGDSSRFPEIFQAALAQVTQQYKDDGELKGGLEDQEDEPIGLPRFSMDLGLFPPRPADPKTQERNDADMARLFSIFTPKIQEALNQLSSRQRQNLVEITLDIGRPPMARIYGEPEERELSSQPVTRDDLKQIQNNPALGKFASDQRAGLDGTLHRVSGIFNRQNQLVGLTVRVGKVVEGSINNLIPVFEATDHNGAPQSILIMGRPGVGKTTILRQVAKHLSLRYKAGENSRPGRRVVIVDTSNEIAGDGDQLHPAIGLARRLQVPTPEMQHKLMQIAVENHNPETIIIDEIGNRSEAEAARTIAERGVQLIATAHGNTFENLLLNPELNDLVGGITSVTLGDEEAKRRKTQKTVLERKGPPTFRILIEMQDRYTAAVYPDVADAVDRMLRGKSVEPEIILLDAAPQKADGK